jgi:hypothetical protein
MEERRFTFAIERVVYAKNGTDMLLHAENNARVDAHMNGEWITVEQGGVRHKPLDPMGFYLTGGGEGTWDIHLPPLDPRRPAALRTSVAYALGKQPPAWRRRLRFDISF